MEQLEYIVEDSTIAEVLGVQNFTSKESAILEVVKNAYDAQAQNLSILILDHEIIFKDDGVGMNEEIIRSNWMHVGKSERKYIENGRVMAGSKGVGRFALARLGRHVIVDSYRLGDVAVRWDTDWNTSNLETIESTVPHGTIIHVYGLRDKWPSRSIQQLRDFLERACTDDVMKITIETGDLVLNITNHLNDLICGKDYLWQIKMHYCSKQQELVYSFLGDEFKETAQQLCDVNIREHNGSISISNEIIHDKEEEESKDICETLTNLGDFSAIIYFQNRPGKEDIERFLYKENHSLSSKNKGVVLYRNAFSISGYEGNRDWLELGKRSRKSPAAASHPTGAWRVRENQIFGKVEIDKKNNKALKDLSNRQGMEENESFKLFIEILTTGISYFERYRQSIIRSINKKNQNETKRQNTTPWIDFVLKDPKRLGALKTEEQRELAKEIREEKNYNKQQKYTLRQTEQRYRYDIRILNTLATLGLRASSMAHEMNNDRNAIVINSENIINALKYYGYWDELTSPDKTRLRYRNVPKLLEISQKVETKMVSFMDVMLTEVEKQKFRPQNNYVFEIVENVRQKWMHDYSKLSIQIVAEETAVFYIAEDIIITILDNLVLNTVQQNEQRNRIGITIEFRKDGDSLWFSYKDDGVGLAAKYRTDPSRILEVHETTRENGHGLGMWIVSNSINYTNGKILWIGGDNGFEFTFTLGSEER